MTGAGSPEDDMSVEEKLLSTPHQTHNDDDEYSQQRDTSRIANNPYKALIWSLLACIFVLSIACGYLFIRLKSAESERSCARKVSVYSPLLDVVEYEERDFDNAFAHQTIYRGPPTREREAAWRDLWAYQGVRIPEEQMASLNRSKETDPRTWKSVPPEKGGGYHGMIEVFHQLHCLDIVRQYTWRDYYERHPDKVDMPLDMQMSPVEVRMHTDHCLESLRLTLMCHGDVTPYLIYIDPEASLGEKADFSAHHKCVKFEPLVEYMKKNTIGPSSQGHDHGHDH